MIPYKNKDKIGNISVTETKETKTAWADLEDVKYWARENHYLIYWETDRAVQILKPGGIRLTFSVCNQTYFDKLNEGDEENEYDKHE